MKLPCISIYSFVDLHCLADLSLIPSIKHIMDWIFLFINGIFGFRIPYRLKHILAVMIFASYMLPFLKVLVLVLINFECTWLLCVWVIHLYHQCCIKWRFVSLFWFLVLVHCLYLLNLICILVYSFVDLHHIGLSFLLGLSALITVSVPHLSI